MLQVISGSEGHMVSEVASCPHGLGEEATQEGKECSALQPLLSRGNCRAFFVPLPEPPH